MSYFSTAKKRRNGSFDFEIGVVYYSNTDTYNGSMFEFYGQRRRLYASEYHVRKSSCFAIMRALMEVASKLIHRSEQRSRCLRGYPHRESGGRLW